MRLRAEARLAVPAEVARYVSRSAGELRRPIGLILLEMGVLSEADFIRVLAEQERRMCLFGEAAQALGLATAHDIQRAVERQQHFQVLEATSPLVEPLVVAAYDPGDPLSQMARELRGEISGAARSDGRPVRVVAVIGVDAAVQATLLAANLGVAFGQAGYRTLLADTNLGSPIQNKLFHLPNRVGVSGMLSREGAERGSLQRSPIQNLTLLTAGPAVPNATELFDRGRLVRKLRPLTNMFEMVLLDAGAGDVPGVAACEGADAVLLVLRKDISPLKLVRRVRNWFEARGTMILGSVLVR